MASETEKEGAERKGWSQVEPDVLWSETFHMCSATLDARAYREKDGKCAASVRVCRLLKEEGPFPSLLLAQQWAENTAKQLLLDDLTKLVGLSTTAPPYLFVLANGITRLISLPTIDVCSDARSTIEAEVERVESLGGEGSRHIAAYLREKAQLLVTRPAKAQAGATERTEQVQP